MSEPMVLCPVCRVAIPDREYYAHARTHQRGRIRVDDVIVAVVGAILMLVGIGIFRAHG